MSGKSKKPVNDARRQFLHAAKGIGALGAIALLLGKGESQADSPAPVETVDKAGSGGYHETEHIRKYYRTARYW